MNIAIQNLTELKNKRHRDFYNDQKLIRNYENCIALCNSTIFKLCVYNQTSDKYTIATIKINVPECSEIQNYTDIIRFTTYIENGERKTLPNNSVGLIPNYTYEIGDSVLFENINRSSFHQSLYDSHYLIEVKIPFIMD
jgi:hypothetical protein